MPELRRCVYLCVDELDPKIQAFREEHDPLGHLIEPHITLIFPFESGLSDKLLMQHVVQSTSLIRSFDASMISKPVENEGFVYFQVEKGESHIRQMHDKLYMGPMAPYLLNIPYVPHITVGRTVPGTADSILEKCSALEPGREFRISRVKIERVHKDGRGEVIDQIVLGEDI